MEATNMTVTTEWWVYVIQSQVPRFNKKHERLPGVFYVGSTTDPARRLREHNGLYANGKPGNPKGGKYTSKHRSWQMMALFGPYSGRSDAFKAEMALKRGKRGVGRIQWTPKNSPWCWGLGVLDPRIGPINEDSIYAPTANPALADHPHQKAEPDDIVSRSTPKEARTPHEKG